MAVCWKVLFYGEKVRLLLPLNQTCTLGSVWLVVLAALVYSLLLGALLLFPPDCSSCKLELNICPVPTCSVGLASEVLVV